MLTQAYNTSTLGQSTLTICTNVIKTAVSGLDVITGRPMISHGSDSITVTLPYYSRTPYHVLSTETLQAVRDQLSSQLGVRVQLRLVLLTTPYLDAQVLACYISEELLSQTFSRVVSQLFTVMSPIDVRSASHIALPSSLVGVKIVLAGRIEAEPMGARITDQSITLGTLSNTPHTVNAIGSHTAINALGTYTIKVWLCSYVTN
jgi:ribosomal protein S3